MRALALCLTIAAAGCATAPPVVVQAPPPRVEPPAPPPPTLEGEWRLAVLRDAPTGANISATLKIDAAQASGAAGCRAWTAGAVNFGSDLRFADVTEATNACAPGDVQLERKVLDVVTATRSARIRDGYLILIDESGRERAYFKRMA